jgi:hypothetical protein
MLLERLLCHPCIGLWETQYFQRFELVVAEVIEHGPCLLCDVIDLLSGQKERRGEIGSPCLTSLLHCKLFPGAPLRSTEVEAEARIFEIHWIH